ncbi:uncharacterized protein LOC132301427 [Cornus florida]|uniref:uncharacterized protein LOC132301427 n=1 Tax=Cornus florida TaxID=4283 RepID=UPI0028A214A8|nr:uncharacterized protein LOC132301427 [Cornus florida]
MGLQSSPHSKCAMFYRNLSKLAQHIDKVLNAQSREDILKNRMRLKITIETVRFLALQGIGFRGHDESSSSLNRGNFIQALKYKAEGNDELSSVILDNAPQNAQYIAPSIQKEILHILANRVRKMIYDEIAGGKYCILVDEAQDESKTEQMDLVLRYIKHDGLLIERFFDIVGVKNTSAVTLMDAISNILVRFDLSIQNLRVSTTKIILQKFRQDDWDIFLANVVSFYNRHNIDTPNLSSRYVEGTGRHCQQQNHITVEHHYHFDIFNSVLDLQLMELEHRFNNEVVELLSLSSALDPSDSFECFNVNKIYNLAEKFYPWDFTGQDVKSLKFQLIHYQLDVPNDPVFQNTSSLTDLCGKLVARKKSECYPLVDRLIRLVLTFPISTATTERAFSGMKRVKTVMRNTMGDEFLADCMIVNLKRDLV